MRHNLTTLSEYFRNRLQNNLQVAGADTKSGIEVLSVEEFVRRYEDREFDVCEEHNSSVGVPEERPPAQPLPDSSSRARKYITSPQKYVQRVLNSQTKHYASQGELEDVQEEMSPGKSTSTLPNNVHTAVDPTEEPLGETQNHGHQMVGSSSQVLGTDPSGARSNQGQLRSFSNPPPGWRSLPLLPGTIVHGHQALFPQQHNVSTGQPEQAIANQNSVLTKSGGGISGMIGSFFGKNTPKSLHSRDVYPPNNPSYFNAIPTSATPSAAVPTPVLARNHVLYQLQETKPPSLFIRSKESGAGSDHVLPQPRQLLPPNGRPPLMVPGTIVQSRSSALVQSGLSVPSLGAGQGAIPSHKTMGPTAPVAQVSMPSPPSNSCSVPDESEAGDGERAHHPGGPPVQRARSIQRRSTRPKSMSGFHLSSGDGAVANNSGSAPADSVEQAHGTRDGYAEIATTTVNEDGSKITTVPLHADADTFEGETVYVPNTNAYQQQQSSGMQLRPPNRVGNSPVASLQAMKPKGFPGLFTHPPNLFQGAKPGDFRSGSLGARITPLANNAGNSFTFVPHAGVAKYA